jgi:hypothetical protein
MSNDCILKAVRMHEVIIDENIKARFLGRVMKEYKRIKEASKLEN